MAELRQLLGSSDSIGFNVLVPSAPTTCSASCDDGDGCTSDACADGQCQQTPPGLAGVTCCLDALTSAPKGAPKSDLRPAVKRQLLNGLIGHLQKLGRRRSPRRWTRSWSHAPAGRWPRCRDAASASRARCPPSIAMMSVRRSR
jgi:hypothetical protein